MPETSFTINTILALSGTMILLALMPSVSVLAITVRAASGGFLQGAATTLGILLGDIIFILIAVYGLSLLADVMGSHFTFIRYLGAAYLLWLGITLCLSSTTTSQTGNNSQASLLSSFLAGLLITLADQKAILFYLGFFPAWIDMSTITHIDTGIIILIATIAISSKLLYAIAADRAGKLLNNPKAISVLHKVAGGIIITVAVFLVLHV